MRVLRAHRRLTGWIAVLAVLLAALAPALSHALASGTDTGWAEWGEVCTAHGSRWVQTGDDSTGHAPASAHALDHCPACSLHAPALGLPPAASPALPVLPPGHAFPPAFLSAPRTPHAWVSAQPRAPPPVA